MYYRQLSYDVSYTVCFKKNGADRNVCRRFKIRPIGLNFISLDSAFLELSNGIYQYFILSPFAFIRNIQRRCIEYTKLINVCSGMASHSSVIIRFKSSILAGLRFSTLFLTMLIRFSIGFRSGLLAGQPKTLNFCWLRNSVVFLLLCFGSLSWTSRQRFPNIRRAVGSRLSFKIVLVTVKQSHFAQDYGGRAWNARSTRFDRADLLWSITSFLAFNWTGFAEARLFKFC